METMLLVRKDFYRLVSVECLSILNKYIFIDESGIHRRIGEMSKISETYDRKNNKQISYNLSRFRITTYEQTSSPIPGMSTGLYNSVFSIFFFIKSFSPVGRGVAALSARPSCVIAIDRAVDVVFTLICTINIHVLPHGRKLPPRGLPPKCRLLTKTARRSQWQYVGRGTHNINIIHTHIRDCKAH